MDQIGLINLKTELPKFLTDFLKNNEIPDTEKKQVTEQVTKLLGNADKNKSGKGDGYVTYDEVDKYMQKNPGSLKTDLQEKILEALDAWNGAGAEDFKQKLETAEDISVKMFNGGAKVKITTDENGNVTTEKTITHANGKVTLGKQEYEFALNNANLKNYPEEPIMVLELTDPEGNSIKLDEQNIPKSFIQKVIDKKPEGSSGLR
jgi:hypothetical protein